MAMSHQRRLRALARLAEHDQTRTTVRELAARVHYSPSHVRTLFRTACGEPLGKSRRRRRLDAVAARLALGPARLLPLARAAGYASIEALNRAFKRRFGRAPSVFSAAPILKRSDAVAIGLGLALARHFAIRGDDLDG